MTTNTYKASDIKIASVNASQKIPYVWTDMFAAVAQVYQVLAENHDLIEKGLAAKAKSDLQDMKKLGHVTKASVSYVAKPELHTIDALNEAYQFFAAHKKVYVQYKIDAKGREYAMGAFSHFSPSVLLPLIQDADECLAKAKKAGLVGASAKAMPPKLLKAAQAIKSGDASAAKFFVTKQVLAKKGSEDSIVKFSLKLSAIVAALVVSELNAAA